MKSGTTPTYSPWLVPEDDAHFVQFYENDSVLVKSVNAFIGSGLGAGEGALILALRNMRMRWQPVSFPMPSTWLW